MNFIFFILFWRFAVGAVLLAAGIVLYKKKTVCKQITIPMMLIGGFLSVEELVGLLRILLTFSLTDAASIGIIGGADGPTSIFVAGRLSGVLWAVALLAVLAALVFLIIQKVRHHKNDKDDDESK